MGQMLKDTERATGNQHTQSAQYPQGTEQNPTLAELGVTWKESSKAQAPALGVRW